MKVLRIIGSLDRVHGGPTTAARAMSHALVRAGAQVEQITTVDGGAVEHDDGSPQLEDGVVYRYFRRTTRGTYHHSRGLARYVRDRIASFDVAHVEGLFQHSTVSGCRSARRAGVPYVLGPLGALGQWSIRHRAWKKWPHYYLFDRGYLANAAALHANSPAEARDLERLGFGDRTHLIPLGVDLPVIAARPPRADATLRILFLSRLHPVKGLPVLMEAIAALRDGGAKLRLTIAGSGEPAYERTLRALVDQLRLREVVRFAGHIEGAAKDALFRESDVFALTSFQESFGLAVAEALAYRLPVLITPEVGIAEEVRAADAGWVVDPDPRLVTKALSALHDDEQRRLAMGERGARLVAARYSWESTARRLIELYEEVARGATIRRPLVASPVSA